MWCKKTRSGQDSRLDISCPHTTMSCILSSAAPASITSAPNF